jgi:7-keto-8-aminopelargonate synthetase-like enzyme
MTRSSPPELKRPVEPALCCYPDRLRLTEPRAGSVKLRHNRKMTELDTLQQVNRTGVRWKNRTYTYFGGCDYFRLASHRKVLLAMRAGLRRYGLNVAASRLTTGNHLVYEKLESALARFFEVPAATLVANGYAAAPVAAQALQGRFNRVLMDEKSHPSLQEASRQFRCLVVTFRHRDPHDLTRLLARGGAKDKPILLTDGLFSHNGEVAPLAQYLDRMPAHGVVFVDDAHGAGILGAHGRGAPEYAGVPRDRIVQTISLSKAFGTFGGAILGDTGLRENIFRASPMFAGSTPLPPPLASAALAAVEMVRTEPRLRQRLERNVQHVRSVLSQQGFPVSSTATPIVAFHPSSPKEAAAMSQRLLARKVFPSLIKYPGAPEAGYFRFAIASEHTPAQLDDLLKALTAD